MLSEKEQKEKLEEYFERKLSIDEVFIVEVIYAGIKMDKNQKERFHE